jgi:signal transduction histidine kinase
MNKRRKRIEACKREKRILRRTVNRQRRIMTDAARMIFDDITQNLSTVNVNLETALLQQEDPHIIKTGVVQNLLSGAISNLRQIGNRLNDSEE